MNDFLLSRRSGMTLFSTESCIEGHACRMVLNEKEVECAVEFVELNKTPNPILEWNPYGESPTLVDRDITLYGSHIIAEYLDDRLPHPPLMPPDPASRGRIRLMLYRCQRDWLRQLRELDERNRKPGKVLRYTISQYLVSIAQYLGEREYWLGREFTLVDCFLAPLLWRLELYEIEVPPQLKAIPQYANRLFARESFGNSLSQFEREMNLS